MDDLSNEKIRESLIQLGYNAGPVTNSTRSVYLNKLQKMLILAGGDSEQSIATDKAVENVSSFFTIPVRSIIYFTYSFIYAVYGEQI